MIEVFEIIAQVTTTTLTEVTTEASSWGPSQVIALVAAVGTILAVMVTGVSIWLTYRGSGKRLEHENELQQAQVAEDRRKEGLDAAVKAYSLTAKVVDHTRFHNIQGWAEAGMYMIDSEASLAADDALEALEMVRVLGWEAVRGPALNLWLNVVYMKLTANTAVRDLQDQETDALEVKSDVEKVHRQLSKSLDTYREAINK